MVLRNEDATEGGELVLNNNMSNDLLQVWDELLSKTNS